MVACSAGVSFERAICSRKRHVETSRREEEMGRVFRPRTYRKGYHFSPQSSTVIKSQMGATTSLRTQTRFHLPKTRHHCRLYVWMIRKPVLTWNFKFNTSFKIYHNLFRKVEMRPIAMTFLAKLQTSKDLINYGLSTIIRLFEQRGLDFSYLFSADRLLNFTQTYDKCYSKISKTEIKCLFWINDFTENYLLQKRIFPSPTPMVSFVTLWGPPNHYVYVYVATFFIEGYSPHRQPVFIE